LHKYNYANGNPVNLMDPSGFQTEPSQPCSYGMRYCKLTKFHGFTIDVYHFDDSMRLTSEIAEELNYGIGKRFYAFSLGRNLKGVIPFHNVYSISLPKTMQKGDNTFNGVALGIFMDFQYSLEQFESLSSLVPFICTEGHCSGFANEDLPSDYLGFVAQIQGWGFPYIVDKLGGGEGLNEFPEELSGTVIDTILCSLGGICGEKNPYNRCWAPKILEIEDKFENVPWPSNLLPNDLIVEPIHEYWRRGIVPLQKERASKNE
jgi:hypothetical protein